MLVCPRCGDEFEPGVARCPDDDVALVPPGTVVAPPPPEPDTPLGSFHPALTEVLAALLDQQDVPHERRPDGSLAVPVEVRTRLRSELVANWDDLVARVPDEARPEVRAEGGMLPGWRDAPEEVWVDREGQLQAGSPDEANGHEGSPLGPGLIVGGAAALLVAWTMSGDAAPFLAVGGGLAVLLGAFLPR